MSNDDSNNTPIYAVWHDTIEGDNWNLDQYLNDCGAAVAAVGGELLTWDFNVASMEGEHPNKAIAIVKFPSKEKFDEFYKTPAYQDSLKMRLDATKPGSFGVLARGGLHK